MMDNFTINNAQKEAHQQFLAGYEAYACNLKFPEACNEGDYSGFFWAGFSAAKLVYIKSQAMKPGYKGDGNYVLDYDEPKVSINWRYRYG